MPRLDVPGWALGDFQLALRGLLDEGVPVSAASRQRLKARWQREDTAWTHRRLDNGVGVSAGAGWESRRGGPPAALLVLVGALTDGRKVVLAFESGQ